MALPLSLFRRQSVLSCPPVSPGKQPQDEPVERPCARTFGPVPSRRFGQSLGLNTIPPKTCTYSCVYCQVGRTNHLTTKRKSFCDPGELYADVRAAVEHLQQHGQKVDYLTFVPDGEPTLDSGLGTQLELVAPLGIPRAVISNASLIFREDVRGDLAKADRVSVKIDAVRHDAWRRIDRPHGDLRLEEILDGVLQFAREYQGELDTETMLVEGMNDSTDDLLPLATFLGLVSPRRAYLSVPIRPPAEEGIVGPDETGLVQAFQILSSSVEHVEVIAGFEGNSFASTGDVRADLLSITAVHPLRVDQVEALLQRSNATWDVVEWLIRQERLREVEYGGHRFIVRRFCHR